MMRSPMFHSRLFHSGVFAGIPRSGGVESTYGLRFDGVNDYVQTTTAFSRGSVAIGVALWAYVNSYNLTSGSWLASQRQSSTVVAGEWQFLIWTDKKLYGVLNGTGFTSGPVDPSDFPLGAWQHVAMTSTGEDGAPLYVYRNGILVATRTMVGDAANVSKKLEISAYGWDALGGPLGKLNGRVDDLRIYGRLITQSEVAALYAGENVTDGLTAYFPFEEGSGTSTTDSVGGLVGTLNGGVTWSTDVPGALAP